MKSFKKNTCVIIAILSFLGSRCYGVIPPSTNYNKIIAFSVVQQEKDDLGRIDI